MKWLTKLRTFLGHDEEFISTEIADEKSSREAEEAFQRAQEALHEATRRRGEARQITQVLNTLNSRNHYGESIMIAMMPKGK